MSGFIKDNFRKSILGGGTPGVVHTLLGGGGGSYNQSSGMTGGGIRSTDRLILREAFGNKAYIPDNSGYVSPLTTIAKKTARIGPFRAAMSAGDVNGTVNEATSFIYGNASNQVNGLNPNISSQSLVGWKQLAGGVRKNGNAAYTGNPKFVYDGADYVRFKKLNAINNTYNDKSYGGSNNGSQSAFRAGKRGLGHM